MKLTFAGAQFAHRLTGVAATFELFAPRACLKGAENQVVESECLRKLVLAQLQLHRLATVATKCAF